MALGQSIKRAEVDAAVAIEKRIWGVSTRLASGTHSR